MVEHSRELRRIVSGGQTGVDRAALELGRATGIPIGGWCPAGGWAEDLADPPGVRALFPELLETPSSDPGVRSEWNVRDSNATLVLLRPDVDSPGTEATIEAVRRLARAHLVADVGDVATVRTWLDGLPAGVVLNVAGPRESEAPGIHDQAVALLAAVLVAEAEA
ncbi:YpsA SLOG family protein [Nocardioides pocheonensis]|uniref:YpsA SLOG family protein n=1 Tax=Nocardioides pocheonensis TaxID=661485 RepID=UPI0016140FD5|nr:putative molybdenum carrier protein [Nocardioides pocheonensis]